MGTFIHDKSGEIVRVLQDGLLQAREPLPDMTPMRAYQSITDGRVWFRSTEQFEDGRFTEVPEQPGDKPIAYTKEGRPLFDNTPTVVVMVVPMGGGRILAIRRANEPGKGKLALPGGYHMRGETWQQAGAREVLEETGFFIDPAAIFPFGAMPPVTDEYGNNLLFGLYPGHVGASADQTDGEAQEVLELHYGDVLRGDWAFPLHQKAAAAFLL